MREETIIMQALKNEQARIETMKIIEAIRQMGGEETIQTGRLHPDSRKEASITQNVEA